MPLIEHITVPRYGADNHHKKNVDVMPSGNAALGGQGPAFVLYRG